MANSRRIPLYVLSVTLFVTSIVTILPLSAQAAPKFPSAMSFLADAKAALAQQNSVHIVVVSQSGKFTNTVVVDIGKTSGAESITSGSKTIIITVTPTYAYLRGSASGLRAIMGLTPAQEKIVGNHSVSMKAGTTPYNNFRSNLTTVALVAMLPAVKGTSLSTSFAMHHKSYVLRWSSKASGSSPATQSVLRFSTKGPRLPFGETVTSSSGSGTTTFSKWGEPVSVVVPPSSSLITYSKLFG